MHPGYGSQTSADVFVLEAVMREFAGKPCRWLDIGVHAGNTSRGVKRFMDAQGSTLEWWGVDSRAIYDVTPPFDGAHLVIGDSAESFHQVPDQFDVVFVDGCHCVNHAILDTLHYGAKIVPGGFILFHDTAPHVQHTMKDPHGPAIPLFHNSVLAGLALLKFPTPEWKHWLHKDEPSVPWGGVTAYQKV